VHGFDDETHQPLALVEVKGVEALGDSCGEVGYTPLDLVVAGELVVAGLQRVLLSLEPRPARGDLGCPALQFGQGDQVGLVQVGEASPLCVGGVDLPADLVQLASEQLVGGHGVSAGERCFTGEEKLRAHQYGL